MDHRIGTGRGPVALPALALLLAVLWTAPAAAQTSTPFVALQPPYLDVANGVNFGGSSGQRTVQTETDGVPGLTPADFVFPLPDVVEQNLASFPPNAALSPTRRWLVLWGTATGVGGGVELFVYRLPATNGALLEPLVVGRDMAGQDQLGFYDDPDPAGRHVFCFVESEVNFAQRLHWVDLDTGVSAWSQGIGTGVGSPILTSPGGEAAFVRTDGAFMGTADYDLIELCADDLGTVITPAGAWQDLSGPVSCDLLDDGTDIFAEVHHDGTTFPAVPLDPCDGTAAPTGACCVDWTCVDGVTQSVCESELGGVWQGAGSDCAGAGCPEPPAPVLELTRSGPSTIPAATPATFTLSYANTGDAPALNAAVSTTIPPTVTFVSAGAGGVYDQNLGSLVWSLGDLADGASGAVTFRVEASCQTSQFFLPLATLTASNAATAFTGGASVTVQPASTAPVTVTLTRTLPDGEPLGDGDAVVYDIAMTNPEAEDRLLNLSFSLGQPVTFDAVLDSAGGSVTATAWSVAWSGVVQAQQTGTLSVRGVLPGCRTATFTETRLNEGQILTVRNACFAPVGSVASVTTALAPPSLETDLELTAQGSARTFGGGPGWVSGELARPGGTVEVRWVIRNTRTTAAEVDPGGATCNLAGLVPAADPPFVAPTPPGTVWNAGMNQASWGGIIAGGDSVVVRLEATYPAVNGCSETVVARASLAGCTQVMSQRIARVYGLGEAWTDPHLVSLTAWGEMERLRPGLDLAPDAWFCTGVEIFHSMSRVDADTYWLVGLPTLRLDATTLDVAEMPMLPGLDMHNITCAVEDTTAGVVYLGGNEGIGGQPRLRLRRVDLATLQVDDVLNDTEPVRTWISPLRLILDRQGRLVMTSRGGGLTRLDPNDSTTVEDIARPDSIAFYHDVSLMDDGRYLVPEYQWASTGLPRRVAAVDPTSLDYEILGDQDVGPWTSDQPAAAAAQGDSGRVYLAYSQSLVGVLDITADPPTLTGVPGYGVESYTGLAFSPGATPTAVEDRPEAPPSLRTLFAGAAPNPFNPRTELRFELASPGPVRLDLYDVQGRRVRTLVDRALPVGVHRVAWQGRDDNGRELPSGLYLARFQAPGLQRSVKLMLTR